LREFKAGKKSLLMPTQRGAYNGCIRRICAVYKFLGGTEDDKSAAFIGSPLSRKSRLTRESLVVIGNNDR